MTARVHPLSKQNKLMRNKESIAWPYREPQNEKLTLKCKLP